jgi:hypothetical protein
MRLDGYVSTNLELVVWEEEKADYTVKLFAEEYAIAMSEAQQSLDANRFEQAKRSVATAMEYEPADPAAVALRAAIAQKEETLRQQQLVADKQAAEQEARIVKEELEAVPELHPNDIVRDCLITPSQSEAAFSELNTVKAAQSNPVAVPVAAATDVAVKGIELVAWPFHRLNSKKEPRFNQTVFFQNFENHVYRYYGKALSCDLNNREILMAPEGASKESCAVSILLQENAVQYFQSMNTGSNVWVVGRLTTLEETNAPFPASNRLVLENSKLYAPGTLLVGQ